MHDDMMMHKRKKNKQNLLGVLPGAVTVAMYPASCIFGIMCPPISIDMKDTSRFWIKLSHSASGMPANRDLSL
jgi:hypothetical protein